VGSVSDRPSSGRSAFACKSIDAVDGCLQLQTNVLNHGDDLDILRRYLPDAAVDLVYLDPPAGRQPTITGG
jgi:hypothetical protein